MLMGHISAPVRIAQRGRSPELRSLTRLRPLSAPFVQGARPPSGLAPCDLRSGPTLPRPPHPAPRTVTIAKRPSHRDGMKELNPNLWVLSRRREVHQDYISARHGRACPGHPRLEVPQKERTWITGTSPVMTPWVGGEVSATTSSLRVFAGTVTAFPHKRERRRAPRPIKSSGEGNVAAPLHVSIGVLRPLTARKRHRVVRHASQGRHRAGQGTVNIACLASLGALR
jgi:hypothetical protein